MACDIHKDQPSIVFQHHWVDCYGTIIDISGALVLTVKFQRPSGTTVTKVGVMPGGGTDGIESYTSIAGDLNEAGVWKVQYYTDVTGWGEIFQFTVEDNLP